MADEEEEEGGGWLVSFADLMTLLFAAFVVLYGITPQGSSDTIRGIVASIRSSFVEFPDLIPDESRVGPLMEGKFRFEATKTDNRVPSRIKKTNRIDTILRERNLDLSRIEAILDDMVTKGEGLQRSFRQAIQVSESEVGLDFKLAGAAFFKVNSTEFAPGARRAIAILAKDFTGFTGKIRVDGHVQMRAQPSNMSQLELSAARAEKILREFLKASKLPKAKTQMAAFGALKPARGDGTDDRVEIRVFK